MLDHVVYFITADGRSTHAFSEFWDAQDALPLYLDQYPNAQLVGCQPVAAHQYHRQPLLKLSEETK